MFLFYYSFSHFLTAFLTAAAGCSFSTFASCLPSAFPSVLLYAPLCVLFCSPPCILLCFLPISYSGFILPWSYIQKHLVFPFSQKLFSFKTQPEAGRPIHLPAFGC